MRSGIKELVLSSLSKESVPICKVAQKTNISAQTASKYCYILEAEGKIVMQSFGNMKLVRRR